MCLIDEDGAEEIPYLVSHVDRDTAIVVPAELIEHEVRTYGTLELSRRLRGIDPDELAQFGIDSLTNVLFDRFPESDF